MRLTVNGEAVELEGPCILEEALLELGHEGRHFAVAVDGNFVPRGRYASLCLQGGEQVEVLKPMQGG